MLPFPWRVAHRPTIRQSGRCLTTTFACFYCFALQAQPSNSDLQFEELDALTPDVLIAAIELRNPSLQSVATAAQAAAFRVEPAGALADPTFSYGIAPNSIGSDIGVRHIFEFTQPLPWPGKRQLREDVAAHRADEAARNFDLARLDLVKLGHQSFAEWHYLAQAIVISAETHSLLSELVSVIETRYAVGRALQQDVLQVQVETLLIEERQLALEHEQIALRARINALLNREPNAPLPSPAALGPPMALPAVEVLRERAVAVHPEIRRIEARVAAANSEVDLADKAFLPDFSANLGYVGIMDPTDKRLQIGVSIQFPLYRNRRRAERSAANADLQRNRQELEGRRVEILAGIESAYTHTHHAMEVVRLYESELLELSESNLNAALSDYESGAGQFLNVVTAERQLLDTRQRYERARADYWRMRAELDQTTGGALTTISSPTAAARRSR